MREIKFRAWDKKNKEMSKKIWTGIFNDSCDYDAHCEEKDLVLMQFTGLTDKNGRGIYEGDILEINSTPTQKAEVYFDDERIGFRIKTEHPTVWIFSREFMPFYKVIGNVWENKQLLRNKKI